MNEIKKSLEDIISNISNQCIDYYKIIESLPIEDRTKYFFYLYQHLTQDSITPLSIFLEYTKNDAQFDTITMELRSRLQYCLSSYLNADSTDVIDLQIPIANKITELKNRKKEKIANEVIKTDDKLTELDNKLNNLKKLSQQIPEDNSQIMDELTLTIRELQASITHYDNRITTLMTKLTRGY